MCILFFLFFYFFFFFYFLHVYTLIKSVVMMNCIGTTSLLKRVKRIEGRVIVKR